MCLRVKSSLSFQAKRFHHAGASQDPVVYKAPYVLPWLDSSDDDPEAGIPFEAGKTGEGDYSELMHGPLRAVVRCPS